MTVNTLPSHHVIDMEVAAVMPVAKSTKQFVLKNISKETLPPSEAGAHIGVHLPNNIVRQYSLVVPESNPSSYTIAVKQDLGTSGGSKYMVEHIQVGTKLQVEVPRNNFPLNEQAQSSVFFAGGIGVTPIWCMVQRMLQLQQHNPSITWKLYYACQTRNDAAFLTELEKLEPVHLHFDDEQGGFLDIPGIIQSLDRGSHLYCCGPAPMLATFEKTCAGWPQDQIHVEYFSNSEQSATEGGFVVELARSKMEVFVPKGKTILDAIRAAGVDAPSSCEEGVCGSCEMRVISGIPDHRDIILSESERAANKTMMICCSGSKSPRLVLDY